jgi:hypothetical protein
MATQATDPRLLLLHGDDNVLVARGRIGAGERIAVEGRGVAIAFDLKLGHKLARRDIAQGERIVKYGAPIGRAHAASVRSGPASIT